MLFCNFYSALIFYNNLAGGSGGTIRDAGGAFGKLEAAREEEYVHKLVCFILN
jgi:hypothetical protein